MKMSLSVPSDAFRVHARLMGMSDDAIEAFGVLLPLAIALHARHAPIATFRRWQEARKLATLHNLLLVPRLDWRHLPDPPKDV